MKRINYARNLYKIGMLKDIGEIIYEDFECMYTFYTLQRITNLVVKQLDSLNNLGTNAQPYQSLRRNY
jgi:hypothetical protein